jgi:hypothetical protein
MDHDYRAGRQRLPGHSNAPDARVRRDEGVRRVRTMSNWTAAALVAGVAVTGGYFAHAATVATPQTGSPGIVSTGQPGTTAPGHKRSLTHPVVTSGGSGVTAGSAGGAGGGGSHWGDN